MNNTFRNYFVRFVKFFGVPLNQTLKNLPVTIYVALDS